MQQPHKLVFRKIRGRIVPIKVAGQAALVGAVGVAAVKKPFRRPHSAPDRLLEYGSYATQVASGLVGAFPAKGKFGIGSSIAGSIALDAVAVAMSGKSVAGMMGSKWKKTKEFARQQAIGNALGYGVFGIGLLANRDFRQAALKTASKVLNYSKRWVR